jgi:hypothetical protein
MTTAPQDAPPGREGAGPGGQGAFLPTVADWEPVFDEAGWQLVRTNRIDITVGEVVFEPE